MANITLDIQTYKQEGDLNNTYSALRNLVDKNGAIKEFNTDKLTVDLNNPLNIECQPSYDGTVNLIINDDINPPRIVNTRFSKLEDSRYKIINRNQLEQTNLYKEELVDRQTRLFRNINTIPKIDLLKIYNMGQLMGGNYTFYVKFADNDYNKTDVVCESSNVSIFKGKLDKVNSISGTLQDEATDKAVTLRISNIDTSFSKMYIYFIRETSDTNGIKLTKAGMFSKPYEIRSSTEDITINGYEEVQEISPEEINIQYNIVTAAKTQAQVQNMLFFGNVQGISIDTKELQNISYFIQVQLKQSEESIGWISETDYTTLNTDDIEQTEYYNPNNIYYKLGYWPDEMYRLGIVYIMNDDSLSPVFNLRGKEFSKLDEVNFENESLFKEDTEDMNYIERDDFISGASNFSNTFGVFKNPNVEIINYTNKTVKPIYYHISINDEVTNALKKHKIKGFFIVRQKRIPTSLCQGLSIGIDSCSHVPMLYDGNNYFTESFLDKNRKLTKNYNSHIITTQVKQGSGLLCLDSNINKSLQNLFDGTEFVLKRNYTKEGKLNKNIEQPRHYTITQNDLEESDRQLSASVVHVDSETPLSYINTYGFSTKCGVAEDVSQFSFFGLRNTKADNQNLLRGLYCPFLGLNTTLDDNNIYTIKIPNYSRALLKEYFRIRGNSNAEFFAISDRYELGATNIDVYRGDCYTNTVTIRLNRNFTDSTVPISEIIVDEDTWRNNYKGYLSMVNGEYTGEDKSKGGWSSINRGDVNTVPLGMWVTFKVLSNYNLGIRSEDRSYTDEKALMGSYRSFYPLTDISVDASHKIEESWILNSGYSTNLGYRRNYIVSNVPYIKELFDNRVMFSNVQRDDDFQNAYRIFQGLSYQDIDRQYGAIIKLISWGTNLLSVFEHGIGILPINEKALIQTTTGQSIHMYGAGVLQNQISLISPDFGSIWAESIVRTPYGVYGVDTYAKKIWRVSQQGGLEIISDGKVQRFLNENIKLKESDKYPIIGLKNVKTHFNNYKGDVMFTFYNEDSTWNLCFNERINKWITKYSWTPLYSENINNIFYSLDRDRAKILGVIYDNINCQYGLHTSSNQFVVTSKDSIFISELTYKDFGIVKNIYPEITCIETSYLNENDEDVPIKITNPDIIKKLFVIRNQTFLESRQYSKFIKYFKEETKYPPVYYKIYLKLKLDIAEDIDESNYVNAVMGLVVEDNRELNMEDSEIYGKLVNTYLRNGFFVHGKAGIFNEMDYEDPSFNNEILPTKWYNKQEPFEFEFVVNGEIGAHKIFDNLIIISNNVQPNEIEYEIVGDVYNFNKAGIFRHKKFGESIWNTKYSKPTFRGQLSAPRDPFNKNRTYQSYQEFEKCEVIWDTNTNQYYLRSTQPCKNIIDWGRRLGNIHYKEDSWYVVIEPIVYKEKFRVDGKETDLSEIKQVRLRDKFIKIRVKYTGEDLVIITALQTIMTQSFS